MLPCASLHARTLHDPENLFCQIFIDPDPQIFEEVVLNGSTTAVCVSINPLPTNDVLCGLP